MEKKEIQLYVNNLRRIISRYLKSGIALKTHVFPYASGAIVELQFDSNGLNKDEIRSQSANVAEALKRAQVNNFIDIGPSANVQFSGTNIFMTENKIFFIKDDNLSEWNERRAYEDVQKILTNNSPR